ncbi:unnamed protein product, partial [Polarella glacialis]
MAFKVRPRSRWPMPRALGNLAAALAVCWATCAAFTGFSAKASWPRPAGIAVAAAASGGGSGRSGSDNEGLGEMLLDEEFRRGETLEKEFANVLEARRAGTDVIRERGSEAKGDLEINALRASQQASEIVSGININGPTL